MFSLPNKDEFLSLGAPLSSLLEKLSTRLRRASRLSSAPPLPSPSSWPRPSPRLRPRPDSAPYVSGSALRPLRAASHFRFRCGQRAGAEVGGGDEPVSAGGGPDLLACGRPSAQLRPRLGLSPGSCAPPLGPGPEGRPPRSPSGPPALRRAPAPRRRPGLAAWAPPLAAVPASLSKARPNPQAQTWFWGPAQAPGSAPVRRPSS